MLAHSLLLSFVCKISSNLYGKQFYHNSIIHIPICIYAIIFSILCILCECWRVCASVFCMNMSEFLLTVSVAKSHFSYVFRRLLSVWAQNTLYQESRSSKLFAEWVGLHISLRFSTKGISFPRNAKKDDSNFVYHFVHICTFIYLFFHSFCLFAECTFYLWTDHLLVIPQLRTIHIVLICLWICFDGICFSSPWKYNTMNYAYKTKENCVTICHKKLMAIKKPGGNAVR